MRHIILTAALIGALVLPARATVLVPTDLGDLSQHARAIALGEVIDVRAQWTDDRRTIETLVTLSTESYLKGELGQTVTFRVPGGTMGRFRNIVVGAPDFEVGQRVIVFLGASGPRVPYVLGLAQGVYRVGVALDGAVLVTPPAVLPTAGGPVVRGAATRRPAPLAEFERQVKALAGGSR
ncbi:MAG: hypothetical protein AB7Q29_06560 [Vicinamibacterales bacterium]